MKYLGLELYKLKRRKVFLTFALILGVELLFVFSNYGNNENFLGMISDPNAPAWEDLIVGPATMNGLFLPILAAVIASRICDMEHRGNTWKLLECNNENRKAIWFCKFTVVTVLMLAAILIQALVIVAYGNAVGIVEPLPVKTLWEFVLGTVMVTFVVVTIQVFFSLVFCEPAYPDVYWYDWCVDWLYFYFAPHGHPQYPHLGKLRRNDGAGAGHFFRQFAIQ